MPSSWIIASTAGSRCGSHGGDGDRGGHDVHDTDCTGCTGDAGRQLQQLALALPARNAFDCGQSKCG